MTPPTTIAPNGITIEPTILFLILLASVFSSLSSPLGTPKIIESTEIAACMNVDKITILQNAPPTLIRFVTGSSGKIPRIV